MTKDEALMLALEALEEAWYHVGTFQPTEKAIDLYDEARTAIKKALAQPEQEPVTTLEDLEQEIYENTRQFVSSDVMEWMLKRYYTTPPQRKPLTDEDLRKLADKHLFYQPEGYEVSGVFALARAIEAAHGIKGEA
jgi:hypothetical protein